MSRLLLEETENHVLEMALIEHSATAERTTTRLAPTTPESARVEPKVLRPRAERPGETRPTTPTVHCFIPLRLDLIAPVGRQSAPPILRAIYLRGQKLYLTIYRRKPRKGIPAVAKYAGLIGVASSMNATSNVGRVRKSCSHIAPEFRG